MHVYTATCTMCYYGAYSVQELGTIVGITIEPAKAESVQRKIIPALKGAYTTTLCHINHFNNVRIDLRKELSI